MEPETFLELARLEAQASPPRLKRQSMLFFLDSMAVAAGRIVSVLAGSDSTKANGLLFRFESRMWNEATVKREKSRGEIR